MDAIRAWWQFSVAVVSFDDVSGLVIAGMSPDTVEGITPEGWLQVVYASDFAAGDVWEVSSGAVMLFEGGGELELPEDGVVTS
jgi:hypothetical protein